MSILVLIVILFLQGSLWAKTGFYSAAFDPATSQEIEFIKSSLQEKSLDRLIVMIERTHSDGYLASGYERVKRLEGAFTECKDKIHILVEPWSGKDAFLYNIKD